MATRRDFVKSAGTAMAGGMGFPALVGAHGSSDVPSTAAALAGLPIGGKDSPATNGYL